MLSTYRDWLESELKLLGNASHHAYSFGQANMAKRAIERLDAETAGYVVPFVPSQAADAALAALDAAAATGTLDAALVPVRDALARAVAPAA